MPPRKPKASRSKDDGHKEGRGSSGDGNQEIKYITEEEVKSRTQKAKAAVISYNTINILDPPKTLKFGEWNDRATKRRGVDVLVDDFRFKDFTPGDYECMFRVMVERSHVVDKCINTDMGRGVEAPELQLTDDAKLITAFGGRHRRAAVQQIVDGLKKDKSALDAQLAKLRKGDGDSNSQVSGEIGKCEKAISILKNKIKTFSTWGVIVYDAGEYFIIFCL